MSSTTHWVVKGSFITNKSNFFGHASSADSVMKLLHTFTSHMILNTGAKDCYKVPYLILQERVFDISEVKVIFLGCKFSHIADVGKNTKHSLPNFSTNEIVEFASASLQLLRDTLGYSIVDGLVRVDVFQSNSGHLVVNEFESLDANYECRKVAYNNATVLFLARYWEGKLLNTIHQLFMSS